MRCLYLKLLLPMLLLCLVFGCGAGPETARRVLLITLDTVRADALSCYGFKGKGAVTSNLDRLAGQGTIFRRASCQIPATLTSHTAIMSGRLPRSTGVRFAADRVPDDVVTVAEVCKEAGFSTAAFLSSAVLDSEFGLDQGFDIYDEVDTSQGDAQAERPAKETTDLAVEWLRNRRSDEAFFLWVHYYDAHSPYVPHNPDDVEGPYGYDGPVDGSADQITQFVATKGAGLTERDLARLRALYLAEVTEVDRQVGRLLDVFDSRESNLASLVVAVSDHGENLGEGGRFFHGADLYETCMHVPLIIRWPHEPRQASKVDDLVLTMDVMPTILKVCGLRVPETVEAVDLAAYLDAAREPATADRVALLENEHAYLSDADKIYGAATKEWKLIDRRHSRRSPVLVGRSVMRQLSGPCYLRAWKRGDSSVSLVAHIRFHTNASLLSLNPNDKENQPTILVRAFRFGIEPIHSEFDIPEYKENWTLIATTDLYERAMNYGKTQGWPLDHVYVESIAVDVSGIPGRRIVEAWMDDVTLVGRQNVILDDFEENNVTEYEDAGVGTKHIAGSRVEEGQGINNSAALHVVAKYPPDEDVWEGSEFYRFENPTFPVEVDDLLSKDGDSVPRAREMSADIDYWLSTPPATIPQPAAIDPGTQRALRSLGYL